MSSRGFYIKNEMKFIAKMGFLRALNDLDLEELKFWEKAILFCKRLEKK